MNATDTMDCENAVHDLAPAPTPLPVDMNALPDELSYFGQYGLALICAKMLEASARALVNKTADAKEEADWINGRAGGVSFADCAETLCLPVDGLRRAMFENPKRVMVALHAYAAEIPHASDSDFQDRVAQGPKVDKPFADAYISRMQRHAQRG